MPPESVLPESVLPESVIPPQTAPTEPASSLLSLDDALAVLHAPPASPLDEAMVSALAHSGHLELVEVIEQQAFYVEHVQQQNATLHALLTDGILALTTRLGRIEARQDAAQELHEAIGTYLQQGFTHLLAQLEGDEFPPTRRRAPLVS